MNRNDQAQKGFKTFLLTLSISLIVFSVVYYVAANISTPSSEVGLNPDIESQDKPNKAPQASAPDSVFNTLASQKLDVSGRAVLSATDTNQTTSSTGTPEGGVTSITVGLITSVAAFLLGMFIISKDPRKMAIKGFEKRASKD